MVVRDVVCKKTDRAGSEEYGRIIGVANRSHRVTVMWETGKISDHDRKDLVLVESAREYVFE